MLLLILLKDLPFEDGDFVDNIDQDVNNNTYVNNETPLQRVIRLSNSVELFALLMFLLYLIFYINGHLKIKKNMKKFSINFLKPLSNYIYYVPMHLSKRYNSVYRGYISGRTFYKGGLVTVCYPKILDPLGYVFDKLFRRKLQFYVEIIIDPKDSVCGTFIVTKFEEKQNDLEQIKLNNEYYCFTNLETASLNMIEIVNKFTDKYPNAIKYIEINDRCRFELINCGTHVSRIDFSVNALDDVNEDFSKFVIDITDSYILNYKENSIMQKIKKSKKIINTFS